MTGVLIRLGPVVAAAIAALVAQQTLRRLLRRRSRRSYLAGELARRAHRPVQLLIVLLAVGIGVRLAGPARPWRPLVLHAIDLAWIAVVAWVVAALLLVLEDGALVRFRTDVPDNLRRRRAQTQIKVIRRLTIAVVVVLTLGTMLMTFPAARAAGASVL